MGIRIPRVTINADFGNDSAFGELSLISLGYGMHQAWVFATMFGTSSVFGASRLLEGLYGSSISLSYLISICVYSFCLIFMGITNQRFLRVYVSRRFLIAGAVMSFLGTTLLLLPVLATMPALELLSGVLTGVGSSILIIFWGTAFARCDTESIVFNSAIAVFVSFVLFATVLHYAPWPISGSATALMPLLELAVLWGKTPESFYRRDEVPLFKPLPINKGKFMLRFASPVFVLGIALGMLRSQSLQGIVASNQLGTQPLLIAAAGLATVLILVTIMAINGSNKWSRFFQPLIPFIAVTVFFIPLSGSEGNALANTFLIVGFLCFESLMWIFFGDLSQRFRLSPIMVFGVGRGTMAVAVLLGSLAPIAAAHSVQTMLFGEQTIIVIMLLIMVVAYAMLPREHEMEAIVMPCPLVKAVSASFEREEASAKAMPVRNCGQAPEMEQLIARASAYPVANSAQTAGNDLDIANPTPAGVAAGVAAAATANTSAAIDGAANASAQANGSLGTADAPDQKAVDSHTDAGVDAITGNAATTTTSDPTKPEGSSSAADARATSSPANATRPGTTAAGIAATDAAPAGTFAARSAAATPSEARLAMERGGNTTTEDLNERIRGGGRFRRKCEAVANTYLLSRRETEILFFLAKGHNAAYIQEKLFISEGTAKTHIRHIYRKLDVHSQQDLMRTVEGAEPAE